MHGFLEDVIFELSFKDITKGKIKRWCWEMVAVFHVEGMCVQTEI